MGVKRQTIDLVESDGESISVAAEDASYIIKRMLPLASRYKVPRMEKLLQPAGSPECGAPDGEKN